MPILLDMFTPSLCGVCVAQSLVFCVVLCSSLFFCFYCVFFANVYLPFDLGILITHSVSSNNSITIGPSMITIKASMHDANKWYTVCSNWFRNWQVSGHLRDIEFVRATSFAPKYDNTEQPNSPWLLLPKHLVLLHWDKVTIFLISKIGPVIPLPSKAFPLLNF